MVEQSRIALRQVFNFWYSLLYFVVPASTRACVNGSHTQALMITANEGSCIIKVVSEHYCLQIL